jgi:hypothetical protein
MLDSTAIMMLALPGRGLYESFYFRGTSPDGRHAFWLKHNMLRYRGSEEVWLEAALILFDRTTNRTSGVHSNTAIGRESFGRMASQAVDWEHVALDVPNGSIVKIGRNHLGGELIGEGGRAHWDMQLRRSDMRLEPFPHAAMYRLPWPANKLLTRDCHIDFHGSVWAGDLAFSGTFHGMNGHNWGTGHAHSYAYSNCAQFKNREDAYFDGFSARVGLAGGRLVTPWLTMASLHTGTRWHHFNRLRSAARQKVRDLGDYRWQVELVNETHRLEVTADGGSPATVPWAALHYAHPDRLRSVIKNTKFASLKLRLCTHDGTVQDELESDVCELETLLPRNAPSSDGYFGSP